MKTIEPGIFTINPSSARMLALFMLLICALSHQSAHAQTPVSAGSGSYASFLPSGAPGDGTFYGPDIAQMGTLYSSLYISPGLKSSAIPTNHWWSDLMFSLREPSNGTWAQTPFSDTLWVFPEAVAPTSDGMQLYYPTGWTPRGNTGVVSAMVQGPDLQIDSTTNGHTFAAPNPVVTSYGDWSVTYEETDPGGGTITTGLARGVPFVWAKYTETDPEIDLGGATPIDTSGNSISTSSGSFTAQCFALTIGGQTFGVFAPPNTTFDVANGVATAQLGTSGYMVYALLPDPTKLSEFETYAYADVTGTTMNYSYDQTNGRIDTTWTLTTTPLTGTNTSTLQGWLPHHYHATINDLAFKPYTYITARGTLQVSAGTSFQIDWPFHGMAPVLPAPHTNNLPDDYQSTRMEQFVNTFAGENRPGYVADTYGQGKEFGISATYMEMADQLGMTSAKQSILTNMENLYDNWLTYTSGKSAPYFGLLPNYGALIGIPESYGTGDFNDQHFHYGYFMVGAGLTGMEDPTWLQNYGPMLTLIAKEYANWDRTDPNFPYFRTFDIWEGHSWAGGFSSPTGENQESSSEAVNSWVGLFMLGNAMGNQQMMSAGAMGYAMETSAVNEYWQDWKHTNYPSTYGLFGCAILAAQQIQYQNYFSADPFWEYAIEYVPINHWNDYLVRDPDFATQTLTAILAERAYANSVGLAGFSTTDADNDFSVEAAYPGDYVLGVQALTDPNTTATELDNYYYAGLDIATGATNGVDLPGATYYITHTLRALGRQDPTYYTNIPTSMVYYNASTGVRTAVIYNAQSTQQTATVYDNGTEVTTVDVPAGKLVTATISGSEVPVPGQPGSVTAKGSGTQVVVSWSGVANATGYNIYRVSGFGNHYFSGITTTSFTDTGLAGGGDSYAYQIYAVNTAGQSQPSSPVSVALYGSGQQNVTDNLNDFSLVSSMSANWTVDGSNPTYFDGDTGRATRTVDDTEYLIYAFPNLSTFTAQVFTLAGPISTVKLYTSVDNGASFQSLAVNTGSETASASGWGYYTIVPSGSLPAGVTDLKVEFNSGTGNPWDPQLAKISFTYTPASTTSSIAPPSAPTGLGATSAASEAVLTWGSVTSATSYDLFRSTTAGGEGTTPVAINLTGTTYTNRALADGLTYYFKLAAVNSGGMGPLSTEVNTTPASGVATASAPTGLAATGANREISLSWTASTGANAYNVYRGTTSGGEATAPVASGISGTTYVDTGLVNGTTYYYKVAATNAGGVGAMSTEATATPNVPAGDLPYGGTPWAVPGTVQAENYDLGGQNVGYYVTSTNGSANSYRSDGVDLEDTTDTGGGYDLGWSAAGQWFNYTVDVATAGTYTIGFRVSAGGSGGTFHLEDENGNNLTGPVTVSGTGGWQNWTTVNAMAALPAGRQILQVYQDTGGYNQNWFSLVLSGPLAPTSLTATPGDEAAALSWTAPTGATSYDIYRGTTSGGESSTPIAKGVAATAYTDTGLTAGATYYYRIAGVDSNGTSVLSSEASVSPLSGPPSTPTGLVATPGNSLIALTWSSATGAATYNVYRGTTSGGEAASPIASGITVTTFTNSGLTNGTTYYYKVAAVNPAGTSAQSNQASGTPTLAKPTAPAGVKATGGNALVALSWNTDTGATSYDVYRGTATGKESTTPIAAGLKTTAFTNTALAVGTTYFYKVSAVNSTGTSPLSTEVSATTRTAAPASLTAVAGSSAVALSWKATTGATSYNVYRGPTTGEEVTTPIATALKSTTYTNTGLVAGKPYYYKVSAVNAAGTSVRSNEASATPLPPKPASPSGLTAAGGKALVALVWKSDSGATGYNVYRGTATGKESTTPIAAGIKTNTFTNTGLANGTTYYYKISAINLGGTSALSAEASAMTRPSAPSTVTAVGGNTQVDLNWAAAPGATSYDVYRGPSTGKEVTTPIATGIKSTTYTNTGLVDGKTYYYKVSTVSSQGTSAMSTEAMATPEPAPVAPTGVAASGGNEQITLTWTAAQFATAYNVYRGTISGGEAAKPVATVTAATFVNMGLTNGTTYYYVVKAVNGAGTSKNSSQASATPKLAIPLPPTSVTATAGIKQITLKWTASVSATSYRVYRGTSSGGESSTPIVTVAVSTYVNTGLTSGKTYYYEVKAVNSLGPSKNSTQVSAVAQP